MDSDCHDDAHAHAVELFAMVSAMAAERDRKQLAATCLDTACRISGARRGTLWALDATGKNLVAVAVHPDRGTATGDTIALYPGGQPDMRDPRCWAAFTGRAAIIEDVARMHGFGRDALLRRDHAHGWRTRGLIACPLRGNDDVTVGVLEVADLDDARGHPLDLASLQALERLIGAFAYQAAITIATSALIARNQALVEELEALNERLRRENTRLKQQTISVASRAEGLITASPAMERVLDLIGKVADSAVPVLVLGETGTGKEVVSRLVHAASPRRDHPFVAQNCAALPADLLESELFGHRKGAFTGALADKKGLFEVADGGTLFLDEIGDMPLPLQAKLLRVLQDGEVRPLGATEARRCDVRIVAATHVDLRSRVAEGRFREDLFYRISVFPILLPPLRDRGDVPVLARYFVERAAERHHKSVAGISDAALAVLERHSFPGNVRELMNVIERAVILCRPGGLIEPDNLPPELAGAGGAPRLADPVAIAPDGDDAPALRQTVRRYEAERIAQALAANGGNRTRAAEMLGMSRRSLQEKIARYGLGRAGPTAEPGSIAGG